MMTIDLIRLMLVGLPVRRNWLSTW